MDEMVFGRRYRVTEKIGTGGMADVYKAVDEVLGRTVAIKVLHPRYAADESFVLRFRQEAQAAANLSHPTIVNIYDWGRDDDTYYIVMEWVRGTDLKTLIQQRGPLDPARAAEYAAQVCSALSVAHGYDIIHRDIKPHNIVLTPDGAIKVMDFGIARAGNTTMTQTGSVLGTAQYISPEQAQGRPLGPASDLYSLGVVLYEMTTGRLPFDGDTPVSVALKQVNEPPISPRQVNPDLPPALEAVILKAMEKDPAKRYASANDMRGDLMRFLQGRGVEAAPRVDDTYVMPAVGGKGASGPAHVRRVPARRGPSPWVWVGLVALLILAGVGGAWAMGAFDTLKPVPDVSGQSLAKARQMIADAGLKVGGVENKADETIAKGDAIGTEPPAGTALKTGDKVTIIVSDGPTLVEVPEVVGLNEGDAIATLQGAGFTIEMPVTKQFNTDYDPGVVFAQDPLPKQQAPKGSKVKLFVSQGAEEVGVPYVVEKTKAAAINDLQKAGFKVKVVDQSSDTVAKGIVIDQKPAGGGTAPKGSEIIIYVSTGLPMVTVPNVVGKSKAEAASLITGAGLIVGEYPAPSGGTQGSGNVETQDPVAGKSVVKGSTVKIWVNP